MAMIQPSFTCSKWNMGEFLLLLALGQWPKNDGEKWFRKNIFEIATCGSHFLLIFSIT